MPECKETQNVRRDSMKGTSKKLLCVLLAFVLTFSALGIASFSAAELQDAAAPTEETETAQPQEELAGVGAELSEAAPEAATEAPTTAPTEEPEPTVGRVTNIERDSFDSDRCLLNWDKVPGADGYYVYYLNADDHKNSGGKADIEELVFKDALFGTFFLFLL